MNFILLTHSRELNKPSNTGSLVLEALGTRARRVIWKRKEPDEEVLNQITLGGVLLVYPDLIDDNVPTYTTISAHSSCIIIDSTWQEARKIYNRSDYLHQLPRLALNAKERSRFRLRRNQKRDGLSTVETVVEILQMNNELDAAENLSARFDGLQQQLRPV